MDELRAAFNSVGAGKLDIHLPLRRADEFGALVADFNCNFLNRFLQTMVEIIESEHGGLVNKSLGDGLMAIFGLGAGSTTHPDDFVHAARSMLRRLEKLNTELTATGELPLQIGTGINTSRAIVGSIIS